MEKKSGNGNSIIAVLPVLSALFTLMLLFSCASVPQAPEEPADNRPIVRIAEEMVFEEHFPDNSREWAELENENTLCTVESGEYIFEHKGEKGPWCTWNAVEPLDEDVFVIEAAMRKITGQDNAAYGLIWGFENSSDR